jgi:hypothetical protein
VDLVGCIWEQPTFCTAFLALALALALAFFAFLTNFFFAAFLIAFAFLALACRERGVSDVRRAGCVSWLCVRQGR